MNPRVPGGKEPMFSMNFNIIRPLTWIIVTVLFLMATPMAQANGNKIAFTGGTVLTVSGSVIDEGVILVEDGIITAVGEGDTEIPYDAMEVDCSGMILAPGFVDPHSADGLDIPNENLAKAPFVDVFDAIDPSRFFFEDSLRNGVTTIHVMQGNNCVVGGVSRIVHPIGLSPHEMSRQAGVAMKLSTSPRRGYDRLRQLAELREVFSEYDRWREDLAEKRFEQEADKDDDLEPLPPEEARQKGEDLIRDEDLDDLHRNLAHLVDGRLGAWIYCGSASDVAPALGLISDRGWQKNSVLVLGGDAHLAVTEIDDSNLSVILDADLMYRKRDPISGELIETFIPDIYRDAGVKFAIQPSRTGSMPERFLGYQAARLVRSGVSPEAALRIVTLGAAEICGVADRYGSIEVGKVANLVMWTGDPLDLTSWVQKVWVEGILAYDREKDARLERLFPEVPEEPEAPAPLDDSDSSAEDGDGSSADEDGDKPEGDETAAPQPLKEKSTEKDKKEAPDKKPVPPEDKPDDKPDDNPDDKPTVGGL